MSKVRYSTSGDPGHSMLSDNGPADPQAAENGFINVLSGCMPRFT